MQNAKCQGFVAQLSLSVHCGSVPGPLWISKSMDAEGPYVKCLTVYI